MNTADLGETLPMLFAELIDGARTGEAYMINRGDTGLLKSLDKLSATAASKLTANGSSIAAHVDHLRYGLSLMNRWAAGENPFDDADWRASWRRTRVSSVEWKQLRDQLENEAHRWLEELRKPRQIPQLEMNAVVGSVAHLAYHVGAIRQIDLSAKGPSAND
ncbi:MAG TPA: hypothetical protein VNO75_12800 [Gemmatimonadaceae bacterium]|nr:hypothetical protein [Gemmatimonadaceae bacterium]